jgi:hypothetical protein
MEMILMKKTKKAKDMELSLKVLGAGMFMGTVVIYMVIGALFTMTGREGFNYQVPFALLIQGMVLSMATSIMWVVCFGVMKSQKFFARYSTLLIFIMVLSGVSMLIPIINSTDGHFIWIISGLVSTLAFGTAVAVLSEKQLKKVGARSVLIWEL